MVQIIPPKMLGGFGQAVTGFAEGANKMLSEQLPKYFKQKALSQGLRNLSQRQGLSPTEQFTELASIPGVAENPALMQTYGKLLRQQGTRNAYMQPQEGMQQEIQNATQQRGQALGPKNVQFGMQGPSNMEESIGPMGQRLAPSNPLREGALPQARWTPEQRDADISRELKKNPYAGVEEARERSAENEQRYLSQFQNEQEKDKYLRAQRDVFDGDFDRALNTKLQKTGEGVYKDITGEMLQATREKAYNDLALNPTKSPDQIAKKWTDRLLDTAKTKTQLNTLASRDIWDRWAKSGQTKDKLTAYQKAFEKSGNLDEYFNILKSKNDPQTGSIGFDMSPQAAAEIAYPVRRDLSSYLDSQVRESRDKKATEAFGPLASKGLALKVMSKLQDSDSILSIAKRLKDTYPGFDETQFFRQMTQDLDNGGFNARQKREIEEGKAAFFPNWGDVWFSKFRG